MKSHDTEFLARPECSNSQFITMMKLAEQKNLSPKAVEAQIRNMMHYTTFTLPEATILLNITDRLQLEKSLQLELLKDLVIPAVNIEKETREALGSVDDTEDVSS